MLLKVFKHDFKTASRYELPVLIGLLLATVIGCVDVFILSAVVNGYRVNNVFVTMIGSIVGSLGMLLGFIAVAAGCSIMVFMLYYRFYKSMVTDEAYLTLTLPVSPTKLLLGKLFSAFLWMLISAVATAISFCAIFSCVTSIVEEAPSIFQIFSDAYRSMGFTVGNLITYIICAVVTSVSGLLQVFMAILFAGSVAKKHKALAAIGLVFGINFVVSTVSQIISAIISVITAIGSQTSSAALESILFIDTNVWIQTVISAGLGVLFFFLSRHLIKNKVNLE